MNYPAMTGRTSQAVSRYSLLLLLGLGGSFVHVTACSGAGSDVDCHGRPA